MKKSAPFDDLVVTGTRETSTFIEDWVQTWLALFLCDHPAVCRAIVGDATGVDTYAERYLRLYCPKVEIIRCCADPALPSPERYHRRNQDMVDRAIRGYCLAFPVSSSRGTWDCHRRALRRGLQRFVITPRTELEPWR